MFLGCPIVGDKVYGHRKPSIEINRHFLHASRLKIMLPGKEDINTFEAPLPGELVEVLKELRSGIILS